MPDYYKILGVDRSASPEEIKEAYRSLALRFHPDHNPSNCHAEDRFHLISRAYEVLNDVKRKRFYDRTGLEKQELVRVGQEAPAERLEKWMTDVVDEVFRRKKRRPNKGKDHRYTLELTFVEAAFGCQRSISVSGMAACSTCSGVGASDAKSIEICHVCEGAGEVRPGQGVLGFRQMCEFCQGNGNIVIRACERCKGSGTVELDKELVISVPTAAMDGQRLRYRGGGGKGEHGGADGDLFIVLQIAPDPFFERDGFDVRVVLPITVREAVSGAEIVVPTLEGSVRMQIHGGAFSGQKMRMKERGIPHRRGKGRGDLYVEIKIEMPCGATSDLERLLKKWPEPTSSYHPKRQHFDEEMRARYGDPDEDSQ